MLIITTDFYSPSFNHVLEQSPKRLSFFQKIGDWLAQTGSIDIVLIIGMFGFGLLGAAISSFITPGRADLLDAAISLVQNISVVIVRGFSAAIVIFLATKGSIAAINSGTNDPNLYVLLFACLVGAVFSEPLWDRSKDKILSIYNSKKIKSEWKLEYKPPATPPARPNTCETNNNDLENINNLAYAIQKQFKNSSSVKLSRNDRRILQPHRRPPFRQCSIFR